MLSVNNQRSVFCFSVSSSIAQILSFSQLSCLWPYYRMDSFTLHYLCQNIPMNRGTWRATVHGVTKTQTRLTPSTAPLSEVLSGILVSAYTSEIIISCYCSCCHLGHQHDGHHHYIQSLLDHRLQHCRKRGTQRKSRDRGVSAVSRVVRSQLLDKISSPNATWFPVTINTSAFLYAHIHIFWFSGAVG